LNPLARHVAPIDGGKSPEKVYGNELLIPAIAHSQSRVQSDTRPVESGMTASAASGRQPTAWKNLGYFPSIAAHSAHAQPHVFEDNSENSRLRKAVIEHKATIRDLSARLVKAKVSEAQNHKHSAREARGSHIKAQRQESDVAAKVQPQASSATKLSIPNKHNQDLKLEKTVPPIPHPFDSGPLLTPSREDVQHVQRMEQWQSLPDMLQRQLEQRPSWPEQQSEQRYMHAFDTQLAQVDWQRRGDWNDLS